MSLGATSGGSRAPRATLASDPGAVRRRGRTNAARVPDSAQAGSGTDGTRPCLPGLVRGPLPGRAPSPVVTNRTMSRYASWEPSGSTMSQRSGSASLATSSVSASSAYSIALAGQTSPVVMSSVPDPPRVPARAPPTAAPGSPAAASGSRSRPPRPCPSPQRVPRRRPIPVRAQPGRSVGQAPRRPARDAPRPLPAHRRRAASARPTARWQRH